MKTQKENFLATEANGWFSRNKDAYEMENNGNGVIVEPLQRLGINPIKVLEVGCSNGTKLNYLRHTLNAACFGIDPSSDAIADGQKKYPEISLQVGTADSLPFEDHSFDLIIFGFCLYLCDRKDLFKIAAEADRCLADKGHLVVMDFYPPFPYKNKYTFKDGLFSFKMDHAKLFSWNPAYSEMYNTVFSHGDPSKRNDPDEKVAVTILHKNESVAYPLEPFK